MAPPRAFEDIPYVALPDNYPTDLGPFLARTYGRYGPVFRTTYLGRSLVYLVGPEANRFVLSSNRSKFSHYEGWGKLFGVADVYGNGLLTMDGPEHDRHRRMMNPAFAMSSIDRYLVLMNRIIRERTAGWGTVGEVDVYQEARKITFDVAAEALLGLKPGVAVDRFRDLFVRLLTQGLGARISRERHELRRFLQSTIQERRERPTDDVLGMLIQARDDEGNALNDEQLIAHINILLVAGHETSTSLCAWLLYVLGKHPGVMQRVLSEQDEVLGIDEDPTLDHIKSMRVLDNALSEAERLYPPVANGPRGVLEDIVFNGYHIAAGSHICYAIAATHLLPSVFADPDRFDPDRFGRPREEHKETSYALVGFGGGPRICIGINFAKVEIKATVSHVLRQYDLALVPNQNIVQLYRANGMPLHGIRMRATGKRRAHAYAGVTVGAHVRA